MRMALPQEQPQIAIRPQRRHEPKNFHRPLDRPPAPVVPAPGGMGLQSLITKRTDLVIQLSCGTPPRVAGLNRQWPSAWRRVASKKASTVADTRDRKHVGWGKGVSDRGGPEGRGGIKNK